MRPFLRLLLIPIEASKGTSLTAGGFLQSGIYQLRGSNSVLKSLWTNSYRMQHQGSSEVDLCKQLPAHRAVDVHVKDGDVVGVGSGSTIVYAVQRLGQRVKEEGIRVKCVPSSFQARQLVLENGLELSSPEVHPRCTVAIDGCDEADQSLNLIKGGGGCLAQEKVVAEYADVFVVIADHRKLSGKLGTAWKYVPIEVLPLAYQPVKAKIESSFGGTAQLRMAKAKAGPLVTDNGNLILDWYFNTDQIQDISWSDVNRCLLCTAGVVDTGLFLNMAKIAYFGQPDGSVRDVQFPNDTVAFWPESFDSTRTRETLPKCNSV